MIEFIAKGYKGKTPVILWHVGNYEYEIEFKDEIETKAALGAFSMLLLDTAYEDAMRKLEEIVDGPLTLPEKSGTI
jgi:hypothetical protein